MEELSRKQNRFIRKVISLSAAGVFLDGYDLFIIGVAVLYVTSQNWFSKGTTGFIENGFVNASALAGMFVGALIVGNYADKIGRRTLYVIDLVFFVFFGLLTAMSTNLTELIAFRFLLGIGIGADYPLSSTYVSEFSPKRIRGQMITKTFTFWGLGALLAAIVGFTFGRFEEVFVFGHAIDTWRIMLASGIVPAIVVLVLRHSMPESPRWLLSNGEKEKAQKIIDDLKTKYDLDYSKDLALVVPERKGRVSELLGPKLRRRTMFAWIPWFFMDIGVYGVGISTPKILASIGIGGNSLLDKINAIRGTVELDFFIMIGFVIAVLVIEKIGRLRLQEIGFLGMMVTLLIVGFGKQASTLLIMTSLALFFVFENAGPNTTTWIIPTEIFPTRLRATAQGSASAVSRIGAVFGAFIFPVLFGTIQWEYTFLFIGTFMGLGFVFTAVLGVEAKGLSLEESSTPFLEFSTYLDQLSEKVAQASEELVDMVEKYDDLDGHAIRIKNLEHEADDIVHQIYTRVNYMNKPLESIDVGNLATRYDDILDFINAVAKRIVLFRVEKTREMEDFVRIVRESVNEVNKTLKYFNNFDEADFNSIIQGCIKINELENEADDVLAHSLATVLDFNDSVKMIKFKELYEYFEVVTDKCEDVSDIFRDLVVKYS